MNAPNVLLPICNYAHPENVVKMIISVADVSKIYNVICIDSTMESHLLSYQLEDKI
jgi:hypothetical protein